MPQKIKLVVFIDSFRIGGMHKQVLYLIRNIDKTKFEPIMCTSTSEGGLRSEFEKIGCQLVDLKWKGRFDIGIVSRLASFLNLAKPDIIFITEAQNFIYFQISRFFLKQKIIQIGSFRGLTFWLGHRKLVYRFLDNLLAKLLYYTSESVIVNSDELKIHYSNIINIKKNKPIKVIFNGSDFNFPVTKNRVEIQNELGINQYDIIIVMIARLDPWKDFDTFFKFAKIVIKSQPHAKFLLVGDGILRNELEEVIIADALNENILLVGERKDVYNYINASDISILSTHGEGFSNALLESMSLSRPVVATNVGGNMSVIGKSGISGYLVPEKSPELFAECIVELITNKDWRIKMGEAGKERINNICSIEKYVEAYEALFSNCLN